MTKDAETAKRIMTTPRADRVFKDEDFLSTGLTTLNLASYGRTNGGLCKGFIYRFIGKSQTAKSFISRTVLAEAANNKNFDSHQLIHDDVEKGVLMDTKKFFGQKLVDRIAAPAYSKYKEPIFSTTIDSFYERINTKLDAGESFIWILDSQDALQSDANKLSDGKAKKHAQELRLLIDGLEKTGSILILIHHAKVNIGSTWGGLVTTGGASPEFYATLDIRFSKLGPIKKTVNKIAYPIGNYIAAHVTKNRISGMDRTVKFPLYVEFGIDNIGANIYYLLEVNHWKKIKGIISAEEFDFEGPQMALVRKIEKGNLERELNILVGRVWHEIEKKCFQNRKPRYE